MVDTVQEYVFLSFFYKTTCILSYGNKREKKMKSLYLMDIIQLTK